MNYSDYALERKEEELRAGQGSVEKRIGVMFLRVLFFVLIASIVIVICGLVGSIRGIIANVPDVDSINIAPSGYATFIYDANGNQLQKLTTSDSNRTAVSLDQVPKDLQHAVIAIEDERFYEHNGIDPKGILRAIITGLRNGGHFSEGASTITQQLLKNNVFTNWTNEKTMLDSIKRKFQEQYLAVELEKKLNNKDLILENYLNTINLGAGTYGVEAASRKYFNKDVWDLTLSESTVLAGITQNPSRYNPITHPDQNAERRKRILSKMLELGYITEDEENEALADDVYTRIAEAQNVEATQSTVYSYFVDELTEQVISDLETQKGYTENQAYQLLYSGGLRIYTTQDPTLQTICDEEFLNEDNFPEGTEYSMDWALTVRHADGNTENYSKEMLVSFFRENAGDASFDTLFDSPEKGQAYIDDYKSHIVGSDDKIVAERTSFAPQPQASLILMDQSTGYVKAIEGGRGEKTASLTLNRATNVPRQPGSTFKILSTYAPALESGDINLNSVVKDEPYYYTDGTEVHNSSNSHAGWMTIREAITNSVNVAAVKVLTQITPQAGYDQLIKFGITTLDASRDIVQPLALGGISKGVTNLELTAGYAAIANGGTYTKPVFYTKITDQNGEVIIDNEKSTTSKAVSKETAWLLTSAMQDVLTSGTAVDVTIDSSMAVAGKTGTTNDYRNVWFVGFTPYYTMGIWAGYDNNESLSEAGIGRTYHKKIWSAIMNRIIDEENEKIITDFEMPSGIKRMSVCGYSGLLPSGSCRFASEDYIAGDKIPTARCRVCAYTDFNDVGIYLSDASDADSESGDTESAEDVYDEDDDLTENRDWDEEDGEETGDD